MAGLRLPRHRATTSHLSSAYPFAAEAGFGNAGVYLGTDELTGGAGFAFDPFEAYRDRLVTNPNMLIAGEPGTGKSAAAKCLIYRACGVLGRWVAIADPKGEYRGLADALGLSVLHLRPGGDVRLNPLDIGARTGVAGIDDPVARQATVVTALVATVLRRELAPLEDAAISWGLEVMAERLGAPTLADLASLLAEPDADMAARARTSARALARGVEPVVLALGKLLDRSLRGMFDGPSNVSLEATGPGVVLDLSAVHNDPDALSLVLVAATAWLQGVLAQPDGPPRLQVLDEAWSLLASERTARYLQSCWKLGRAYGVANVAIIHRLSDLRSQADDGTATAKVAMGLLADTQTRILFRQSSDQVGDARELLSLTDPETDLITKLCRGRALWKVGDHTAVIQHVVARDECEFTNTDARMEA